MNVVLNKNKFYVNIEFNEREKLEWKSSALNSSSSNFYFWIIQKSHFTLAFKENEKNYFLVKRAGEKVTMATAKFEGEEFRALCKSQ